MATSKEEAGWVLRAQCGEREALERPLRSVQPSLHRYLCSLVGAFDADDVLQQVLVLVCRKLRWLNTPESFRPWAYRIASRAAFRHLKDEKHYRLQVRDESVLEEMPAVDSSPRTEILEGLVKLEGTSAKRDLTAPSGTSRLGRAPRAYPGVLAPTPGSDEPR